ncbi:MAG TPA: hypothetical protein DEG71_07175 [Clostridiales bacterium]|nr:hypothetical protein [Clostridiales bacterium]
MKTRVGFVSNSSSSSFCIVGKYTNKVKDPNFHDIDWHFSDAEFNGMYIGLSIDKIQDHETIYEFKQRARLALYNIGIDIPIEEIGVHYGGFYDG